MTQPERDGSSGGAGLRRSLLLVLAFGIGIRAYHLLAPRALWADEAKLTLNILSRPLPELLLEPLAHGQLAPTGFLVLEKVAVWALGGSELALRIVPFLGGVASLVLALLVLRELRARRAVSLTCLGLLAVSPYLILYSGMVKQYSTDVACALLVVLLTIRFRSRPDLRRASTLGIGGGIAALLSHGALFVLAGSAAVVFRTLLRREVAPSRAVVVGGVWSVCALPVVLGTLRLQEGTREYMEGYWSAGFLPFPPSSVPEVAEYGRRFLGLFAHPGGMGAAAGIGALAFVVGGVLLARRDPPLMLLVSIPVLLLFPAAALELHPIGGEASPVQGRILLWSVPLLVLGMAYGAGEAARSDSPVLRVAGIAMVAGMALDTARPVPRYLELYRSLDVRRAAGLLAAARTPDEPVYTTGLVWSPMRYYGGRLGMEDFGTPLAQVPDSAYPRRFWLAHYSFQRPPPGLDPGGLGRPVARLSVPGVTAYRVRTDPAPRPTGGGARSDRAREPDTSPTVP